VEPIDFSSLTTLGATSAREAGAILILPVGAVEAHGPHLPLCTDDLLSREMARRAALRLRALGAHLDPVHLSSLREAVDQVREETSVLVVLPDLTRRKPAARLGAEFQSGACHAGQFESSLVLAVAPELVDEDRRRALPAFPVSLSDGIRAGKRTFEELGGHDAYFGDPAAASRDEGEATYEVLAEILVEAITSG
jgi:creatinine amidohydrolase